MLIGTDTFLFGALILNILAWATKTCTDPSKFPFVQLNVTLPGFSYVSISTEGINICVVNCLKRKWCKSFNFNLRSGDCELNFATSSLDSINATHLKPATGIVFSDIKHWPQVHVPFHIFPSGLAFVSRNVCSKSRQIFTTVTWLLFVPNITHWIFWPRLDG